MTASFTEQMLTIYTQLGMLSRGKESPPPCGEGQGWGATFAKTPPCLRFAQTSLPTRGGKEIPAHLPPLVTLTKVRVQLWAAASWIRGFRRNDEGGDASCADVIRASAACT